MTRVIAGTTMVAGVVGAPVGHSLSPLIHNAWLEAVGVDGVYVAFSPPADRFSAFVEGMRGGAVRGVNVTAPFKEVALLLSDRATERARRAGAANLLVFESDGAILADNTDGAGLLAALAGQAPGFDPRTGPAVIFGAGGAARGAVAALLDAGAPEIRLLNRSSARANALAAAFEGKVRTIEGANANATLTGANVVINATTLGLGGGGGPVNTFTGAPSAAVVMDMVYRPVRTRFLESAALRGLRTVDGLAMLIGQAGPSFEILFGRPAPAVDVRALAIGALEHPS